MKRFAFLLACVTAISVGCSDGRDNGTNDRASDSTIGTSGDRDVSSADVNFVRDLATANMAEIDLGKMAVDRGTSAEVKKFGQMMIDDHTAALNKLKAIASEHRIDVPAQVDDRHRDLHDKLAKLKGPELDREYATAMVGGHEDVVEMLESRIDREDLAKWRSTMADRLSGKTVEESGKIRAVLPEKSDDPVTTSLNQWAADAYPVVQGHLQAAKALDEALEGRSANK